MIRSAKSAAFESADVGHLMRILSGILPPGMPLAASAFLSAAADMAGADVAALTLLRPEPARRTLVMFDHYNYKLDHHRPAVHRQNLANLRGWESDPVAARLFDRVMRRPLQGFTYSATRWVERFGWQESFADKTLRAAGWASTFSVLMPVESKMYAILSVAWHTPQHVSRLEARELFHLTRVLHDRVIEMRGRRLRDDLPASVRRTFELILSGATEKEIAAATRRKANTVHDQVKRLYGHFNVNSRAQLMAKFIDAERLRQCRL